MAADQHLEQTAHQQAPLAGLLGWRLDRPLATGTTRCTGLSCRQRTASSICCLRLPRRSERAADVSATAQQAPITQTLILISQTLTDVLLTELTRLPIETKEHGSLVDEATDRPTKPFTAKRVAVLDSVTSVALTSALDGLSLRQTAIADNIANVNTPNYHAKRVAFEDALARSVKAGDGHVVATTARSLEPTQLNGNNVNLDTETLSNIDTVLRYQFAARATDDLVTRMRTAMRTN